MKHAVSISLGNASRNKSVVINLNGVEILVERIGTGGDIKEAIRLYNEMDGKVDAFSVGGIDCYVTVDGKDYPINSALKLVEGVKKSPWVDGRHLKYVLERRVFELIKPVIGDPPHFSNVFMPVSIDRQGLAETLEGISDELVVGDLIFMLGIPIPVYGVKNLKRFAKVLMPIVRYLPLPWLFPPDVKEETHKPKFEKYWKKAGLIAGDMHYFIKYSPSDLSGKWVITNTTTDANITLLKERGVKRVITTTPRYDGRSFGVNAMEAVLTAYAGKGRPLTRPELDELVTETKLTPNVMDLN